ncbi:hypothetical protein [Streptomyces decoyicus]
MPMAALPASVPNVAVRVLLNLGACGSYADILADFEPPGPAGNFELLNVVPKSHLPPEFLPALRAGLLEGLNGVSAAVLLTDGAYHEVDSSDYGYRIAGQEAGRAALIGAGLLPPCEAETLRWAHWPTKPRARRRRPSQLPRH